MTAEYVLAALVGFGLGWGIGWGLATWYRAFRLLPDPNDYGESCKYDEHPVGCRCWETGWVSWYMDRTVLEAVYEMALGLDWALLALYKERKG